MKKTNLSILSLTVFAIACGNDPITNAGYFDDDIDKSVTTEQPNTGAQVFNNYGSGTMTVNNTINYSGSSLESPTTNTTVSETAPKHFFPTDLSYVGIYKTTTGAKLVMRNNTSYDMSVDVNYTVTCIVNGKQSDAVTKTQYFRLKQYEQKESQNSIDGIWHGGLNTIDCTGHILSIVPYSTDESNFQVWTGNYQISTH